MNHGKCGHHSFLYHHPPAVTAWASTAGKRESMGPLGNSFDHVSMDSYWNRPTWEQAEARMQEITLDTLLEKAKLKPNELGAVFSGDLLNQCIPSSICLNNRSIPHIGLYGACSTMAESLLLASMAVESGYLSSACAMTSSHFASSERQYRFPLGYGGQRTPSAQWTVTGSGACLVQSSGKGPHITGYTIGTIVDKGITDAANMGAAMAPAALQTIKSHFRDLQRTSDDYDLIVTGDLGQLGKDILLTLAQKEGLELGGKLADCGTMIFDNTIQDVHAGGSGCGCSALGLCGYFLNELHAGKLNRILFCGTGALLSPLTIQQGLPIPAICHAVILEGE